jgi:ABC-2 type transport system permease protein
MRLLSIALKDLAQILKDWKSGLYLIAMPLAFTLFFGLVVNSPAKDPRMKIGWIDGGQAGETAALIRETLAGSPDVLLVDAEAGQVDRIVRGGKLAAVVIVPEGYESGASDGSAALTVVADSGSVAGRAAAEAARTAADRVLGAAQAARLSLEGAPQPVREDPSARAAFLRDRTRLALEAWKEPRIAVAVETAGQGTRKVEASAGFLQSSPGMIVQFAIYGLIASAMILVLERKSKALQRMLTTPVSAASIVSGHVLAMFVVVFIQQAILVACGQFVFHVDYLRQPVGVLLMMASLGLWTACLGLLIGALAKKEEQVIVFVMAAMFLFSALGGAWFPLEIAGRTFAAIGHLLPSAWAMDGFQNLVLRGLGIGSTLLPAGILLGYAAVFFGLAVWRFRFE